MGCTGTSECVLRCICCRVVFAPPVAPCARYFGSAFLWGPTAPPRPASYEPRKPVACRVGLGGQVCAAAAGKPVLMPGSAHSSIGCAPPSHAPTTGQAAASFTIEPPKYETNKDANANNCFVIRISQRPAVPALAWPVACGLASHPRRDIPPSLSPTYHPPPFPPRDPRRPQQQQQAPARAPGQVQPRPA